MENASHSSDSEWIWAYTYIVSHIPALIRNSHTIKWACQMGGNEVLISVHVICIFIIVQNFLAVGNNLACLVKRHYPSLHRTCDVRGGLKACRGWALGDGEFLWCSGKAHTGGDMSTFLSSHRTRSPRAHHHRHTRLLAVPQHTHTPCTNIHSTVVQNPILDKHSQEC